MSDKNLHDIQATPKLKINEQSEHRCTKGQNKIKQNVVTATQCIGAGASVEKLLSALFRRVEVEPPAVDTPIYRIETAVQPQRKSATPMTDRLYKDFVLRRFQAAQYKVREEPISPKFRLEKQIALTNFKSFLDQIRTNSGGQSPHYESASQAPERLYADYLRDKHQTALDKLCDFRISDNFASSDQPPSTNTKILFEQIQSNSWSQLPAGRPLAG